MNSFYFTAVFFLIFLLGCVNSDKKETRKVSDIEKEAVLGLKLYTPIADFHRQMDSIRIAPSHKLKVLLLEDKLDGGLKRAAYIQFAEGKNETFYGFIFPYDEYGLITRIDIQFIDDISNEDSVYKTLSKPLPHYWKSVVNNSFAYISLMTDLNTKYGQAIEKESDIGSTGFTKREMIWEKDGLNVSLIRMYRKSVPGHSYPENYFDKELIMVRYSIAEEYLKEYSKDINSSRVKDIVL